MIKNKMKYKTIYDVTPDIVEPLATFLKEGNHIQFDIETDKLFSSIKDVKNYEHFHFVLGMVRKYYNKPTEKFVHEFGEYVGNR